MLSSVGFIVVSLLAGASISVPGSVKTEELEIPESQEEPVLIYDSYGGFRAASPEDLNEPMLQIYADGRVVRGRRNREFARSEIRLKRTELRELLEFIINENHFFDISTEQIEQQIKATGKRILIADAPSSRFIIHLGDRKNQVDVYALGFIKQQFAELDDLQRLVRIERRLVHLAAVAAAGGEEQVGEMLEMVNQKLKQESPETQALSAEDLTYGIAFADGRRSFRFNRTNRSEDRLVESVNVSVEWPADGSPKIKIQVFPQK